MTRCIVLGSGSQNPDPKPIGFVKKLELVSGSILDVYMGDFDFEINQAEMEPSKWKNVELICRGYDGGPYDLMFAYDGDRRDCGVLYMGYWNDGIV